MEIDALHGPVDGGQPVGSAGGRREQLVELVDDGLDAAEDDAFGGGEAAIRSACASEIADERQKVDGRHVEACGVDVHCDAALQCIQVGQVRSLGP